MKGKHMIVSQIVPPPGVLVDYLDRNHDWMISSYDIWLRDVSNKEDDYWYDSILLTRDDVAEYFSSISLNHNIVGIEVKHGIVEVEIKESPDHTTNIDANVIESLARYISNNGYRGE